MTARQLLDEPLRQRPVDPSLLQRLRMVG